ncbi:synaptonemal complex central element protein 2-like [Tubulanus polymorphus]|uniref:synaptonemal complex central element protein 2-like n=1 Tax=Tubulanus polymorphus TaxID=672921 RepID=UPI003DA66EE4
MEPTKNDHDNAHVTSDEHYPLNGSDKSAAQDIENTGDSEVTYSKTFRDKARQLFDEINYNRKRDNDLLNAYKKAIDLQIEKSYDLVEQNVYNLYTKQGAILQEKTRKLFEILDNVGKLEEELEQFKHSLTVLYADLQKT